MSLALPALVWIMLAVAAAQALARFRLWRVGAPAPVSWTRGLLALPRRYLVDVHHVVARDPYASRMHMLVAGGLLGATALAGLGMVPALGASRVFWALVAVAFLATLAGAVLVGARRYPHRPQRLSGGSYQVLPILLTAYAAGGPRQRCCSPPETRSRPSRAPAARGRGRRRHRARPPGPPWAAAPRARGRDPPRGPSPPGPLLGRAR